MPCFHPVKAWRGAGGAIVFNERSSLTRVSFQLPCGRCIGCRMEKARQWGVRCVKEAKLWPSNYFATLTYNSAHLPLAGSLSVRDVQLFHKRMRKWSMKTTGHGFRYFIGGEYGDDNLRPHYHALLFNVRFDDLKFFKLNERGEKLYTSETLQKLWSSDGETLGHCTVGELTFDSAVYCAKYSIKKVNGDASKHWYSVWDGDGVVHQRRPEFAVMSLKPGIGYGYYAKYGDEIRAHDNIVVNGRKVRPPRYFDTKTKALIHDAGTSTLLCMCSYCGNVRRRKLAALRAAQDNTVERLSVKERLALYAAAKKERGL